MATLSLGLLLKVGLHTALLRLAFVMHSLVVLLALLVTREASNSSTNGALGAVADARAEVANLTASLLLLTFEILLTTGLLQRLDGLVA